MNYWVFVVAHKIIDGQDCAPYTKLEQRLKDKFWGLSKKVPNRRRIKPRDVVVFYVGRPHMEFAATATLNSDYRNLSEQDQKIYQHDSPCYGSEYGVFLENTRLWDTPRSLEPLKNKLSFTRNAKNLGFALSKGIIKMTEDDFQILVGKR